MAKKSNGSALVRAAKKCHRLAVEFHEADQKFKAKMEERYGEHDELPDDVIEVTKYGAGGGTITLKWLDDMMDGEGYSPIEK